MKQPQQPTSPDNGQPEAPTTDSQASTSENGGAGNLLNQAKDLLNQGSVPDLLSQLPDSVKQLPKTVKGASTNALSSINKLSTTQKVVGGTLLAAGLGYLAVRSRKPKSTGQAATLHELLLFVNDRIEGYQRAVDESQDTKLRGYYKQLVSQSQQFSNRLNQFLRQQEGGVEKGRTVKGRLYRAWMDTKAAITGADEKAILGSNIYGEEWALKAYEDAINDHTLTGAIRSEVERQYAQSQNTYKELQKLDAKL
ncbi:PA2169 family four-helix-bundle protein [Hymenobacter tibetensis]|uniref:PA2169 family four-helix-bundle protein n=1 Tax=Hymenobacter tibetensis TaxID=497967 RepID=A0ABY4CYS3_9BACT|nr:PA2169 family four-helix-bundle protein [Hymenobacter tibetensis]UOG75313.1 PA2169 family four-helix-bundle protein [Hymenobacter tibetensis]